MLAFYVAGGVVAALQYLRLRDLRLLAVVAFFLFEGLSMSREEWSQWRWRWHLASGASVLSLVVLLAPRHPPRPEKP